MEINLVRSKPGGTIVAEIRGELPDVSDMIQYYFNRKKTIHDTEELAGT